jgi:hypothetical protein
MIVRPERDAWLCITQPDHARLAGSIMDAWCADGFPERPTRARVLDATTRHDIGWTAEDAAPRVNPESGVPYDFITAPLEVRQPIWPRAVERLAADDPYAAALVAQHALTVYRRYQHDPAWRDFFPRMETLRDDLVVAADLPNPTSFLQDYTIVGLGDLFSLVFCNGWPEPYLMEGYRAILTGDHLMISPDPFAGLAVRLEAPARRVPQRRYTSDEDFRDTLAGAPLVMLTGMAIGGPATPVT